jgi:hypothetical protein
MSGVDLTSGASGGGAASSGTSSIASVAELMDRMQAVSQDAINATAAVTMLTTQLKTEMTVANKTSPN